jgi:hypothetical protein
MEGFDHILNWTLQRGSHQFPGKSGGTCINEAALVTAGFPYRPVWSVHLMPRCFSRPICRLAMHLNDEATDSERQRLLPFVTRLTCADTRAVERKRAAYIRSRIRHQGLLSGVVGFDEGLRVLEGALTIGRQANPAGWDDVVSRMKAAQTRAERPTRRQVSSLSAKLKSWLGAAQTESVE